MGIPAFYSWLAQKYSRITRKHLPDAGIQNLYVDVNGLIHGACQSAGGEYMRDEGKMLEKLVLYIDRLVVLAGGGVKMVYLAVDGVAPRAKLNQQRGRRFQAGKVRLLEGNHDDVAGLFEDEDQAEVKATLTDLNDATNGLNMGIFDKADILSALNNEPDHPSTDPANIFCFDLPSEPTEDVPLWDSNAITPGTTFMQKVSQTLNKWAESYTGSATVIVSDSNTPGEGEHKFMDFLKVERGPNGWVDPSETHGIVSLDADIILLSLSLHLPNFYIVREDRWAEGMTKFDYIYVDNLREQLAEELIGKITHYYPTYHPHSTLAKPPCFERMLTDWISLMTLAGNDFMPHLPAAYVGQLSGDLFMDVYERLMAESGEGNWCYIVKEDCEIDLGNLKRFLIRFSEVEDSLFRQEAIFDKIITEEEVQAAGGYLSTVDDAWRSVYYDSVKEVGGCTATVEEMKGKMGEKWLEGFSWVVRYYFRPGTASWEWYYPFYHAPFAREIIDFIDSGRPYGALLETPSHPLQPKQQLLAVLPEWSFSLLPEGFGSSYTEAEKSAYPTSWKFDLTGCRAEHHGVPVLPFLDVSKLLELTPETPAENIYYDRIYNPPARPFASHKIREGGGIIEPCYTVEAFGHAPVWLEGVPHPKVASIESPEYIPWREKPPLEAASSGGLVAPTKPHQTTPYYIGGILTMFLLRSGSPRLRKTGLIIIALSIAVWVGQKIRERLSQHGQVEGKKRGRSRSRHKKPGFLKPKRCRVDWICPRCLCKNWEKQEECFRCQGVKHQKDTLVYLPKNNRWSVSCYKSNHLEFVEDQ
eukprot:TRINITY_DN1068_c0_g1_i3.p1 TRINITY_DN1068_c0_g1~~TRINITY_DN1068_c0_g1_i3.p1  ORF type:complete len:832 (+),score=137.88 TRINITY_DN1068_c0_g1_i3:64-2496(+)